jgi:hypothetical protein
VRRISPDGGVRDRLRVVEAVRGQDLDVHGHQPEPLVARAQRASPGEHFRASLSRSPAASSAPSTTSASASPADRRTDGT